jgi:hypothetical protein
MKARRKLKRVSHNLWVNQKMMLTMLSDEIADDVWTNAYTEIRTQVLYHSYFLHQIIRYHIREGLKTSQ